MLGLAIITILALPFLITITGLIIYHKKRDIRKADSVMTLLLTLASLLGLSLVSFGTVSITVNSVMPHKWILVRNEGITSVVEDTKAEGRFFIIGSVEEREIYRFKTENGNEFVYSKHVESNEPHPIVSYDTTVDNEYLLEYHEMIDTKGYSQWVGSLAEMLQFKPEIIIELHLAK